MNILSLLWQKHHTVTHILASRGHRIFQSNTEATNPNLINIIDLSKHELFKKIDSIHGDISYPIFDSIDFSDAMKSWLYSSNKNYLKFRALYSEFISMESIDIILVSEDITFIGQLLTRTGRQLQIPSIHVPHATYFGRVDQVHARSSATHLAVGGEKMAEKYRRFGLSPARIEVTGSPSIDRLHLLRSDTFYRRTLKAHTKNSFGLSSNTRVLCFFTTFSHGDWKPGLHDSYDECLDKFFQKICSMKTVGDWAILIKDRAGHEQRWANYCRLKKTLINAAMRKAMLLYSSTSNVDQIFAIADHVIAFKSNAIVEAALLGISQTSIDHYGDQPGHISDFNSIKWADLRLEDILHGVASKGFAIDTARLPLIEKNLCDGKSSDRVADYAERVHAEG